MRRSIIAAVGAAFVMGIVAAVPVTALAGHSNAKGSCKTVKTHRTHRLTATATQPAIVFGIYGGNIQQWSVSIANDGTVSNTGWVKPRNQHLIGARDTLNALLTLTEAEGFWSMPGLKHCAGTLPDIATRYVEITSSTGSKKVSLHGGCVSAFNEIYATLQNAVDMNR